MARDMVLDSGCPLSPRSHVRTGAAYGRTRVSRAASRSSSTCHTWIRRDSIATPCGPDGRANDPGAPQGDLACLAYSRTPPPTSTPLSCAPSPRRGGRGAAIAENVKGAAIGGALIVNGCLHRRRSSQPNRSPQDPRLAHPSRQLQPRAGTLAIVTVATIARIRRLEQRGQRVDEPVLTEGDREGCKGAFQRTARLADPAARSLSVEWTTRERPPSPGGLWVRGRLADTARRCVGRRQRHQAVRWLWPSAPISGDFASVLTASSNGAALGETTVVAAGLMVSFACYRPAKARLTCWFASCCEIPEATRRSLVVVLTWATTTLPENPTPSR